MSSSIGIVPRTSVGELLKVVGLPTKSDRTIGTNELIKEIVRLIDNQVSVTATQRTTEDFVKIRSEVFPNYVSAMMSLGSFAKIVLPEQKIDQMSWESFSEMEAEFRDHGVEILGSDLTERGLFTAWTLRKIHDLAREIVKSPLTAVSAEEDRDKAMQFIHMALWNRFHVDCLIRSIQTKQAIHPELVEPIQEGLRTVVNVYALVRQWADLLLPQVQSDVLAPEWTGDDELLLGDSMHDLDRELV